MGRVFKGFCIPAFPVSSNTLHPFSAFAAKDKERGSQGASSTWSKVLKPFNCYPLVIRDAPYGMPLIFSHIQIRISYQEKKVQITDFSHLIKS